MDKRYAMLIEALSGTPKDLRRLIKPLDDARTLARPAADQWSIKDVIAHLGYVEPRFRARFERIVAEDNPSVPWMSPDETAHDLSQPASALIDAFSIEREKTAAFLAALTQAQWLRICTHETFGVTRLRKQAEILIGHDNEHLAQIVGVREWLDTLKNEPVS